MKNNNKMNEDECTNITLKSIIKELTVMKNTISEHKIKWTNTIFIVFFHLISLYGLLTFPYLQKPKTLLYAYAIMLISGVGVTAGAHRYYTHRAFKATLPLRVTLCIFYVMAAQNTLYQWVRDHRVHHKYTDTNADPHNSKRGFFFSHVGWLLIEKHPDVITKGQDIDMSDMEKDAVAMFINRHFGILKLIVTIIVVAIPVYAWSETWYYSTLAQFIRFVYLLNSTWAVNSVAHIWGTKPFNKNIGPTDSNLVSCLTHGEGWHNFHHMFPYDYKCPEISGRFDWTRNFLEILEKIGWAYDLRTSNDRVILNTLRKHGDGTVKDTDISFIPSQGEAL